MTRAAFVALLAIAACGNPACPYDDRCTLQMLSGSDCGASFDAICSDTPAGRMDPDAPGGDPEPLTLVSGPDDPSNTAGPWVYETPSGCRVELACDPIE